MEVVLLLSIPVSIAIDCAAGHPVFECRFRRLCATVESGMIFRHCASVCKDEVSNA